MLHIGFLTDECRGVERCYVNSSYVEHCYVNSGYVDSGYVIAAMLMVATLTFRPVAKKRDNRSIELRSQQQ
ncbi:MAG: hypothetical protein ACRC9V_11780 [Aeromonas sp.]